MDSPSLDAEQLELCVLKLEKGKAKYHQYEAKQLDEKIKKYQKEHKDEQDE